MPHQLVVPDQIFVLKEDRTLVGGLTTILTNDTDAENNTLTASTSYKRYKWNAYLMQTEHSATYIMTLKQLQIVLPTKKQMMELHTVM
jgi:hypothetical protein